MNYPAPLTDQILIWIKSLEAGKTTEKEIAEKFGLTERKTSELVRKMVNEKSVIKIGFKNNWDIEIYKPPADLSPFFFRKIVGNK